MQLLAEQESTQILKIMYEKSIKKFEEERETYQDKIKLLKAQMQELGIFMLENEEAYIKLKIIQVRNN